MSTNDPRAYLPGQLLHAMPTVYSDAVATPSPEDLAAVQWHHDQFAAAIKGAQLPIPTVGERYTGTNDTGNWRRWSDGQHAAPPEWLANGPQHSLAVALMTEHYRSKHHYRLHVRDVPCGVAGLDIVQHWCISNGRVRTPWRLTVPAAIACVQANNWTRRPLVPRALI